MDTRSKLFHRYSWGISSWFSMLWH